MIQKITALLAVITATTFAGRAQQLTYTETGGNISGSLNGVNFSDALWTITATADSSTATFYPVGGSIYAPVWALDVTPTLTITSGSTVLSATLTGWDIESRNYSAFNPPASSGVIMFSDANADGKTGVEQGSAAYTAGTSANFNNLQSTGTFTGTSDFDTGTFATSAGNLIVSSDSGQPGVFGITAAAVPEPSALSLSVLGCLGLLLRFRRSK